MLDLLYFLANLGWVSTLFLSNFFFIFKEKDGKSIYKSIFLYSFFFVFLLFYLYLIDFFSSNSLEILFKNIKVLPFNSKNYQFYELINEDHELKNFLIYAVKCIISYKIYYLLFLVITFIIVGLFLFNKIYKDLFDKNFMDSRIFNILSYFLFVLNFPIVLFVFFYSIIMFLYQILFFYFRKNNIVEYSDLSKKFFYFCFLQCFFILNIILFFSLKKNFLFDLICLAIHLIILYDNYLFIQKKERLLPNCRMIIKGIYFLVFLFSFNSFIYNFFIFINYIYVLYLARCFLQMFCYMMNFFYKTWLFFILLCEILNVFINNKSYWLLE